MSIIPQKKKKKNSKDVNISVHVYFRGLESGQRRTWLKGYKFF